MEQKGITIEFYGKSIDLQNTLTDINKGLKATRSELQDFKNQLKIDPGNIDALKGKLKALRQEEMLLKEKAEYFRNELAKLGDEDIGSDKWIAYDKNLKQTEKQILAVSQQIAKIDESGKLDEVTNDAKKMGESFKESSDNALSLGDIIKANIISDAIINGIKTLAKTIKEVATELHEWADDYRELEVYERQFESNIRNTADASDDQIKALKKLAKQKERNGVISSKAITSAYQELATYVESTDAIEGLTDALVDMSAQQYGVDATEESVRNIATTLGKALANGDYSGLTRLGYGFDEAQKRIMKYGDELDRVAVLNEVIESSIGGMNEALATTDAGAIFQMQQYFGDVKESIGQIVSELEIQFAQEVMPIIQEFVDETLKWFVDNKDNIIEIVQGIAEWLTSDEVKQFFEDVGQLVLDFKDILEYVLKVGSEIGLWEGIFNIVKGIVQGIKELFDRIRADVEYISTHGLGSWGMANYNSYDWGSGSDSFTPGWSGGYGSGGYASGGITLNANFNVTANNVTRNDVEMWASWLTDDINEQLGSRI